MNGKFYYLRALLLSMACAGPVSAQTLINVNVKDQACSFAPDEVIESEIYSFASSKEAVDLVERIVSTVGLVPRFDVFAANVPNAAAIIDGEDRLIVYSESWIRNTIPNNKWAVVALMGHEIAHHLNGHTLEAGGSRPSTELEADKFAGFAVGKLGGSLQDAQWLFRQLPKSGSDTHPPQSARLEAVAVGWRDATGGSILQPKTPAQSDPVVSSSGGDWLVIAGSYPHGSDAQAMELRSQLRTAGVSADVVNTDHYSNLRNGLYSVVVKSNSKSEAYQLLSSVKRYVPDAYIKKGK